MTKTRSALRQRLSGVPLSKRSEKELKKITDTINSRLKESQKSKKIKKE